MRTPRFAGARATSGTASPQRSSRAWLLPSIPVLAAASIAGGAACSPTESDRDPASRPAAATESPRSSPEAAALARSLKAQFPAAFADASGPSALAVELPSSADRPLRLRDATAKLSVAIALEGARPVEAASGEDLVVYARAAQGEGDVVHRVLPEGVEDLVFYRGAPDRETLTYHLDVSEAAGLRLVSNVLEVLDAHGAPIFRARAPYVLDASGRHEAALSVEGCAVDESPRAPFGRAVVAPGSAWCTVKVDWSGARVRYPALVDPVWGTTFNTMGTPRSRHTITLLNETDLKSLALVAGGVASVGGAPTKSAEIYDPLSRRFSVTGNMNVPRSTHTATLITVLNPPQGVGPQKPVLIAGGKDSAGSPIGSLEVYDPLSGTFVNDSNTMGSPRFEHAAELVQDETVLLAGGTSPPLNQPTNTAYLYTFTAFDTGSPPPSVQSTLTDTNTGMLSARTGLATTRLTTGKVLLTGGYVLAGGALQALQTAELYDPVSGGFLAIIPAGNGSALMATQRGYHTSTSLGSSGKVLIAGGLSKTVNGIYTNTADIFSDGSQSGDVGFVQQVAITMAAARANHTATLLPDGRVLVAGGFGGSPAAALNTAELFSPSTNAFTDLGALVPMQARGDHVALLVNAGDSVSAGHTVLITGGGNAPNNGSASSVSAQLLLRVKGDPCTVADECVTGFCVDAVCCDKACDEECYACSAITKEMGLDGLCGPAKQGSDPHVQCINQVETHTQCDGHGSTEQTDETHSCKPAACGNNGLCSTGCAKTLDCDETGWCDLTKPSDKGDPGTCAQKKGNGAPCYGDDQCVTALCVDGVCCNTACDQQCQACDLPGLAGTCQTLGAANDPQDVHPNADGMTTGPRTACKGFMDSERTTCTGACRGKAMCDYPDATTFLHADECKDDAAGGPSTLTSFPCDGSGSNTQSPTDCAGYKCADAGTCKASCTEDTDCITDFVCTEGACVALTGPLCDGKDTLRKPKGSGGYEVCPNNYACPAGATACLTKCDSINDCVTHEGDPTFVCTGDHVCTSSPKTVPIPTCAFSPARAPDSGNAWWLAAGAAALFASRRRRRA